jgi:hypothetical protein
LLVRNQIDIALLQSIVHLFDWMLCFIFTINCNITCTRDRLIAARVFTRSAESYPPLWNAMSLTEKFSFLSTVNLP